MAKRLARGRQKPSLSSCLLPSKMAFDNVIVLSMGKDSFGMEQIFIANRPRLARFLSMHLEQKFSTLGLISIDSTLSSPRWLPKRLQHSIRERLYNFTKNVLTSLRVRCPQYHHPHGSKHRTNNGGGSSSSADSSTGTSSPLVISTGAVFQMNTTATMQAARMIARTTSTGLLCGYPVVYVFESIASRRPANNGGGEEEDLWEKSGNCLGMNTLILHSIIQHNAISRMGDPESKLPDSSSDDIGRNDEVDRRRRERRKKRGNKGGRGGHIMQRKQEKAAIPSGISTTCDVTICRFSVPVCCLSTLGKGNQEPTLVKGNQERNTTPSSRITDGDVDIAAAAAAATVSSCSNSSPREMVCGSSGQRGDGRLREVKNEESVQSKQCIDEKERGRTKPKSVKMGSDTLRSHTNLLPPLPSPFSLLSSHSTGFDCDSRVIGTSAARLDDKQKQSSLFLLSLLYWWDGGGYESDAVSTITCFSNIACSLSSKIDNKEKPSDGAGAASSLKPSKDDRHLESQCSTDSTRMSHSNSGSNSRLARLRMMLNRYTISKRSVTLPRVGT